MAGLVAPIIVVAQQQVEPEMHQAQVHHREITEVMALSLLVSVAVVGAVAPAQLVLMLLGIAQEVRAALAENPLFPTLP